MKRVGSFMTMVEWSTIRAGPFYSTSRKGPFVLALVTETYTWICIWTHMVWPITIFIWISRGVLLIKLGTYVHILPVNSKLFFMIHLCKIFYPKIAPSIGWGNTLLRSQSKWPKDNFCQCLGSSIIPTCLSLVTSNYYRLVTWHIKDGAAFVLYLTINISLNLWISDIVPTKFLRIQSVL